MKPIATVKSEDRSPFKVIEHESFFVDTISMVEEIMGRYRVLPSVSAEGTRRDN